MSNMMRGKRSRDFIWFLTCSLLRGGDEVTGRPALPPSGDRPARSARLTSDLMDENLWPTSKTECLTKGACLAKNFKDQNNFQNPDHFHPVPPINPIIKFSVSVSLTLSLKIDIIGSRDHVDILIKEIHLITPHLSERSESLCLAGVGGSTVTRAVEA